MIYLSAVSVKSFHLSFSGDIFKQRNTEREHLFDIWLKELTTSKVKSIKSLKQRPVWRGHDTNCCPTVSQGIEVMWLMKASGGPINWAQVWVYFSWTYQISHEIRVSLTDSQLNNKSLLTLSKMLSRIAVQINLGISSGTQAIVPSDTSPGLTTTTGVTPTTGAIQYSVCQGRCIVSPTLCSDAGLLLGQRTSGQGTRGAHSLWIKKNFSKTHLNVLLTRCWVITNGHYEGRSLHYKTAFG